MGVLSKLLCSTTSTSRQVLQNAPALLRLARSYASSGKGDYAIIDHQYDAVVVGAGGALLLLTVSLALLEVMSRNQPTHAAGAGLRAAVGLSELGFKTA
jgi:hypothetical protein